MSLLVAAEQKSALHRTPSLVLVSHTNLFTHRLTSIPFTFIFTPTHSLHSHIYPLAQSSIHALTQSFTQVLLVAVVALTFGTISRTHGISQHFV